MRCLCYKSIQLPLSHFSLCMSGCLHRHDRGKDLENNIIKLGSTHIRINYLGSVNLFSCVTGPAHWKILEKNYFIKSCECWINGLCNVQASHGSAISSKCSDPVQVLVLHLIVHYVTLCSILHMGHIFRHRVISELWESKSRGGTGYSRPSCGWAFFKFCITLQLTDPTTTRHGTY